MSESRVRTAAAVVRTVQALAEPMDAAGDMWQEFWDVVNGSGAFTDEELEPLGITAAQLASCVTVLENFNKFVQGQSPANDAYRVTINTMRRIGAQI